MDQNRDHKFKHKWTSWVYNGTKFDEEGKMDLESIKPSGELVNGTHTPHGRRGYPLNGKATDEKHLNVKSDLGYTYDGNLTYDRRGNLVIAGRKYRTRIDLQEDSQNEQQKEPLQDDPPWILTKP